jgi:G3E family GTPase
MTDKEEEYDITDADKTPVTIITGFLGSGKTTLVNYILKEQTSWKICVIENEFGEVSIDDSLVETNMKEREDIITMDNGCVCCRYAYRFIYH